MKKDEIFIIYAKHAWNAKYIEQLGYKVCDPYRGNQLILRILREIWFKFNLPFKYIFYNKKCIVKDKIIIIYEALITKEYLDWLHKKCLNCSFIFIYTNLIGNSVRPDQISGNWCEIWTSDVNDAKKYGINLINGGGYLPQWTVNKDEVVYDVFYIGKDKNRLNRLKQIENEMKSREINTFFYITWEKSWMKRKDGIHQPFLSYDEVLNYIGKSKAILHLIDGAQEGITLRIQESLIHKVKLITDDAKIESYDFYNPNNIFILGKDDMDNLKAFLESPYVDVESDFFSHAYYEEMLAEIIKNINNSGEE